MQQLPGVVRESLRRLLRQDPAPHRVQRRLRALQKLHADIEEHVGWPALADSLRQDIDALRERLELPT